MAQAIDDFGAHFGIGAHPTPDEAQWTNQSEHIPSSLAKLAQDAGTEIWTGSRHFGFQDIDHNLFGGPAAPDSNHPLPQPGQTAQQAYDQAHPLIADAHRAARPYQQYVGPMLSTHPNFGPGINHYQHDKVGVFNELTTPLLLGGGMLRGGLTRAGETGTESAVPARPTTPAPDKAPTEPAAPAAPPASSGMANTGSVNSGSGHTANPGEPAGQSSDSGVAATPGGPAHAPAGVPQLSHSGNGARGPPAPETTPQTAAGEDTDPGQPLTRPGHTPQGQQATGEPNTDSPATPRTPRTADDPATTTPTDSAGPGQQRQLLDQLDSSLPAKGGRLTTRDLTRPTKDSTLALADGLYTPQPVAGTGHRATPEPALAPVAVEAPSTRAAAPEDSARPSGRESEKTAPSGASSRGLPVDRAPRSGGRAAAEDPSVIDLYHGTAARYAGAIRENGIDLSVATPLSDFGPGFYVTKDLRQARSTVRWKYKNEPGAILHFRVPVSELRNLDGKSFDSPGSAWEDFVRGRRTQADPMHSYDWVEGPLLWNPWDFLKGTSARASGHQISFHTPEGVDLLNRSLAAHDEH